MSSFAFGQSALGYQTASEKFKSIVVLKTMPADQMGKVMNIMSASLGVNCGFCHEGTNFVKDSVGYKEEARRMLLMTLDLNGRYFEGEPKVTCNTCHRGKSRPESSLTFDHMFASKGAPSPSPIIRDVESPNAAEIWARYLVALGRKERLQEFRSRHVNAKRIEPDGKSEPEEIWQLATKQSRMTTKYGTTIVTEGFDGNTAWKSANDNAIELKPDESEQIRAEAILAFGTSAVSHYSQSTYHHSEQILDHQVHVLSGDGKSESAERLYFDVSSGLLVRRVASVPTILGSFDYQVDYQDYKEFGGVMQPTNIRFCVPNITWTRQVISIEANVDLDDMQFRKP